MNSDDRERVLSRFWPKVNKAGPVHPTLGTACWLWVGFVNDGGYGHFWFEGANHYAHRVSFALAGRVIPGGLQLDHLCRTRNCVRPDHLEAVTCTENLDRSPVAPAAVNKNKTHCPSGHPYDGENLHVRPDGARSCRACARLRARANRARILSRAI